MTVKTNRQPRMLTPADYEARRAAIEASCAKELARATSPHPLWRAVASFRGKPFTRVGIRERICLFDVRRINSVSGDTTLNQQLARLVRRGLLRRVPAPNGYRPGLGGSANYYQTAVDISQRGTEANIGARIELQMRRAALLAALENTWRDSPFYGLTARKFKKLPEMERVVLEFRMAGVTLAQIGRDMGVTREYVRQVQQKAFERLRNDVVQRTEHWIQRHG